MKRFYTTLLVLMLCLAVFMAGCGKRSSGLYTEDEMTQIHDITGSVEKWTIAYNNVVTNSLPSTIAERMQTDPDFANYIEVAGIDPTKPMIALTFDDGPRTDSTTAILDVLEQYNAKATFFVVGSNIESNDGMLEREAELGCEVGNHTYDHVELTTVDTATMQDQLEKTNELILKHTGKACQLIRPCGGAVNDSVRANVDMPLILWYVDTRDWESRNADSVTQIAEQYAQDGTIILMHDIYDSTAEAVKTIVPYLIDQGYQLVTVSELAYMKGVDMEAGGEYFSFIDGDTSNITGDQSALDLSGNSSSSDDSSDDSSDE